MTKSLDAVLNDKASPGVAKVPEKEASTHIEKDCNPKDPPKTFGSLSELVSSRLETQSSAKKFILPKLNTNQSSGSKFILPKLSNIPKFPSRGNILGKPLVEVDDLNVGKINLNEESSVENPQWTIDLTTALIGRSDPHFSAKQSSKLIPDDDDFVPQFIDCDMENEFLPGSITQYCEIDLSPLLGKKLKQRKHKASQLGRILCRKYRKSRFIKISTKFITEHHIEPFNFATPSPDDLCLQYLRR
uniref:Uncharacterized protein n=1 Tax=Nyssomyia neivai TaxID=330878 RepID=A0A1L8DBZ2_9DIPT